MPRITVGEQSFTASKDSPLLDSLLQANIPIPYGCRQGVCQACMMLSLDATPPASSQQGLKNTLQQQNYFLACCCYPDQDMCVALPNQNRFSTQATVIDKHYLAPDILRLTVQYDTPLKFFAGQFINLQREDGLTRSYSIANRPNPAQKLEFHIRRLPHGQFSNWVHDGLQTGHTLKLSHAQGNCHYLPENQQQPLLLIGTGSGLAPLYGIIHDALHQGHSGPIELFHGSRAPDGLYLTKELRCLADNYANFSYTACLSSDCNVSGYAQGRAHEVALADKNTLRGWRVYLCGHPDMVKQTQRTAYIKGASLKEIYTDAFVTGQPTTAA